MGYDRFVRVEVTEFYRGWIRDLKIDFGSGYRVYYVERSGELIVLLAGGDKSSQAKDIQPAINLAKNL